MRTAQLHRTMLIAASVLLHLSVLNAQVTIGGNVFDGSGGPLLSGVVYHASFSVTVPTGQTLTVQPGAIVKFAPATQLAVNGHLHVAATAANRATFTAIADDSAGGDTNGDGPSSGSPGSWLTVNVNPNGTVAISGLDIRYTGQGSYAAIRLGSAPGSTISDSLFRHYAGGAIDYRTSGIATITGCDFSLGNQPVYNCKLANLASFTGNTASGNTLRDHIVVEPSTVTTNLNIQADAMIGGALVLQGIHTIAAGTTVDLGSGLIFRMDTSTSYIDVLGILNCNGTAAAPVVFTAYYDDTWGGDIDGTPILPQKNAWPGIRVIGPGSQFTHAILRYAGSSGFGALELSADCTIDSCVFDHCGSAGIDLNGYNGLAPTITNCVFDDVTIPIDKASLVALGNFSGNSATNCTIIDCIAIGANYVNSPASFGTENLIGDTIVITTWISVNTSLTVGRGVVFKFTNTSASLGSNGPFQCLGTALEPVVFTSYADDSHGGDTDKNGPSTGAAGDWRGLVVSGGPSTLRWTVVRNAGAAGYAAINVADPAATLKSVRVEHALFDGIILLQAMAPFDNLVAFDCAGTGIDASFLAPGGDLRFATATACGVGIDLPSAGGSVAVRSSISWGNTTNYLGATAGQLFDSNGEPALAGTNGNLNVDPLFVDAANGDLHLQAASPCIGGGDFALGVLVASDADEASRVNDADLDGVVGADMGAYEFRNWNMNVSGEARLGQTLWFQFDGPGALGVITVALLDYEYYLAPYGMVLCGSPFTVVFQDLIWEGYPYPITIPNDPYAVGYEIGVQVGCGPFGNLAVGNILELWRGVIRD